MPLTPYMSFQPNVAKLDPVFPGDEHSYMMNVRLAAGTYVKGTVLGEIAATPGVYKAYAAGNADGSQVARGILQYACVADAQGNISLAGEFGQTQQGVPMFLGGGQFFNTAELTGLDAAAITAMGASLVEGSIAAGILRF